MSSPVFRGATLLFVAFLAAACSSSSSKPDEPGLGQGGSDGSPSGGGGTSSTAGTSGGLLGDGGGTSNGCQPQSCEAQGKSCGVIADGCGATLDCGSCADGQLCGVVSPNVCTPVQELCHAATRDEACAGKQCGIEGDGCGNTIDCGTCPDGQGCGLEQAFQCAVIPVSNNNECPARITSCASVSARCGLIGNGCGGTIDCTAELGACPVGELCGLGGPQQCGAFPSCTPLSAAAACNNGNKCGEQSNGCGPEVNGGVVDCSIAYPCPNGQTCGGGGTPNQCGSGGATCTVIPQNTACGSRECGIASNGCGASYNCGAGCSVGELCVAGTCEAQTCTPSLQATACAGKECGQVGDGCGGTHTCGTCTGTEQCGANVAYQCSTPAGGTCTALTATQACAGRECGTAYDGCGTTVSFNCATVNGTHTGSCAQGEFCGIVTPFQCDAPVIPPCTPNATSCAALAWECGDAINSCGTVYDCALEGRSCNALETCVGGLNGNPTSCVTSGGGGGGDCDLCAAVPPSCPGQLTRLTGRVVTPGRNDANTQNQIGVPNAFVYILRNNDIGDLPAIGTGVPSNGFACDRCDDQDLGPVLTGAVTDSTGAYTLEGNIPINQQFLLVTKIGKFRRAVQMTLPPSASCATTPLATTVSAGNPTRLPRTTSDGLGVNIPRIAISTGRIDAMECVFEKMGIQANQLRRRAAAGASRCIAPTVPGQTRRARTPTTTAGPAAPATIPPTTTAGRRIAAAATTPSARASSRRWRRSTTRSCSRASRA